MKDGSTHLTHKAGHAVNMDSGAVVAVTLQAADLGDTTTVHQTLAEAAMAVAELVGREAELLPDKDPQVNIDGIEELVVDKGYHSSVVVEWVGESEVLSYIPARKQAGKRNWKGTQREQQVVEANQSRVTGDYGKQLLRRRSEFVERSFAHCYRTGGMRRCTLRGRENILKRLLIHVGAFNLSLVLRNMLGAGMPRELKNRAASLVLRFFEWLACRYRPNGAVESRTTPVFTSPGTYRPLWNSATSTTVCLGG
jgi:transposase